MKNFITLITCLILTTAAFAQESESRQQRSQTSQSAVCDLSVSASASVSAPKTFEGHGEVCEIAVSDAKDKANKVGYAYSPSYCTFSDYCVRRTGWEYMPSGKSFKISLTCNPGLLAGKQQRCEKIYACQAAYINDSTKTADDLAKINALAQTYHCTGN